jgi:hypothetical protein
MRSLIRRAKAHLKADLPLPLDLFAEMLEAGIDVDDFIRENERLYWAGAARPASRLDPHAKAIIT